MSQAPDSRYKTRFDAYFDTAMQLLGTNTPESVARTYDYIDALDDEDYRDHTFARVARALVSQDAVDVARSFCDAIRNNVERADALVDVARELKWIGNMAAARDVLSRATLAAGEIESHDEVRPVVYLGISIELSDCGDQNAAQDLLDLTITLVRHGPQSFESSKTLAGCARVLAKWGRRDNAIEVAQAIENPGQRDSVLGELA